MPTTEPHQPPSDFSVMMSHYLRAYMDEHDVSVDRIAAELGRSRNFVYEHTNGQRSPDTDLLNAVARLASTDIRSLVLILMERIGRDPDAPAWVKERQQRVRRHPGRAAGDSH